MLCSELIHVLTVYEFKFLYELAADILSTRTTQTAKRGYYFALFFVLENTPTQELTYDKNWDTNSQLDQVAQFFETEYYTYFSSRDIASVLSGEPKPLISSVTSGYNILKEDPELYVELINELTEEVRKLINRVNRSNSVISLYSTLSRLKEGLARRAAKEISVRGLTDEDYTRIINHFPEWVFSQKLSKFGIQDVVNLEKILGTYIRYYFSNINSHHFLQKSAVTDTLGGVAQFKSDTQTLAVRHTRNFDVAPTIRKIVSVDTAMFNYRDYDKLLSHDLCSSRMYSVLDFYVEDTLSTAVQEINYKCNNPCSDKAELSDTPFSVSHGLHVNRYSGDQSRSKRTQRNKDLLSCISKDVMSQLTLYAMRPEFAKALRIARNEMGNSGKSDSNYGYLSSESRILTTEVGDIAINSDTDYKAISDIIFCLSELKELEAEFKLCGLTVADFPAAAFREHEYFEDYPTVKDIIRDILNNAYSIISETDFSDKIVPDIHIKSNGFLSLPEIVNTLTAGSATSSPFQEKSLEEHLGLGNFNDDNSTYISSVRQFAESYCELPVPELRDSTAGMFTFFSNITGHSYLSGTTQSHVPLRFITQSEQPISLIPSILSNIEGNYYAFMKWACALLLQRPAFLCELFELSQIDYNQVTRIVINHALDFINAFSQPNECKWYLQIMSLKLSEMLQKPFEDLQSYVTEHMLFKHGLESPPLRWTAYVIRLLDKLVYTAAQQVNNLIALQDRVSLDSASSCGELLLLYLDSQHNFNNYLAKILEGITCKKITLSSVRKYIEGRNEKLSSYSILFSELTLSAVDALSSFSIVSSLRDEIQGISTALPTHLLDLTPEEQKAVQLLLVTFNRLISQNSDQYLNAKGLFDPEYTNFFMHLNSIACMRTFRSLRIEDLHKVCTTGEHIKSTLSRYVQMNTGLSARSAVKEREGTIAFESARKLLENAKNDSAFLLQSLHMSQEDRAAFEGWSSTFCECGDFGYLRYKSGEYVSSIGPSLPGEQSYSYHFVHSSGVCVQIDRVSHKYSYVKLNLKEFRHDQ